MSGFNSSTIEYAERVVETSVHRLPIQAAPSSNDLQDDELFLDNAFAAAVVGGTAQFISFLFVLITQTSVPLFENLLLGSFIGLCLGLTTYALLTGYDQVRLRRREPASETSYDRPESEIQNQRCA
jgi:hypothetical protein